MLRVLLAGGDEALNDRIKASVRVQWPTARIAVISTARELDPDRLDPDIDVILIDGALPGLRQGQLQTIRADGLPVIVLINDGELSDKGESLTEADDYIVKPFSPLELVARIQVVIELSPHGAPDATADRHGTTEILMPGQPQTFDDGVLSLDFSGRRARVQQRPVFLTATEFDLLAQLIGRRGFVVSNQHLLAWTPRGSGADPTEYLSVHIRRLCDKIEPNPAQPRYILAERGVGYKFARSRRTPRTSLTVSVPQV